MGLFPWQETMKALPKFFPGANGCMFPGLRWPTVVDTNVSFTGCVLIRDPRVLDWVDRVAEREAAKLKATRQASAAQRRKGKTQNLMSMFAATPSRPLTGGGEAAAGEGERAARGGAAAAAAGGGAAAAAGDRGVPEVGGGGSYPRAARRPGASFPVTGVLCFLKFEQIKRNARMQLGCNKNYWIMDRDWAPFLWGNPRRQAPGFFEGCKCKEILRVFRFDKILPGAK